MNDNLPEMRHSDLDYGSELQGFRAGGAWKVRLGADVVGGVYSSNVDRGHWTSQKGVRMRMG